MTTETMTPEELETWARANPCTALMHAHSSLPQPLLEELAREWPRTALRNVHSRLPQSLLEELAGPWRLDPVPLSEVGKLMDWCAYGIVEQMEKAGLGRRKAYPRALLLAAAREAVKKEGHDERWDVALDILERTTVKEGGEG